MPLFSSLFHSTRSADDRIVTCKPIPRIFTTSIVVVFGSTWSTSIIGALQGAGSLHAGSIPHVWYVV